MENSLVPALCALAGSAIGVAGGIACTLIAQRHETKRKTKELLLKAGMEQWGKYLEISTQGRQAGRLYSPEIYMLHLLQFSGLLDGLHNLTDEEIESRIRQTAAKIKLIADTTQGIYFSPEGNGLRNGDAGR